MFTSSLSLNTWKTYRVFGNYSVDRAENRLCGKLLSEVFKRKADYFILTTISEKAIALLHQ